jgi:hypothetical protein
VVATPGATADVVAALVAVAPDAIAVTCTTAVQARTVTALIAAIRREPALARAYVLLGGLLVLDVPQLPTQLGADGGACDGASLATQLRNRLLAPTLARA